MAQYDVHRTADGALLLNCQAEVLGHLSTRMVAPLVPLDRAPALRARLNPVFDVAGQRCAMVTQYAATVRAKDLGPAVASLEAYRLDIIAAFDMLLTGN
nr:CcdB family protein [uncultured Sphingomonas sp.]